jgi:GNAT superfamily N-acetyltransferase
MLRLRSAAHLLNLIAFHIFHNSQRKNIASAFVLKKQRCDAYTSRKLGNVALNVCGLSLSKSLDSDANNDTKDNIIIQQITRDNKEDLEEMSSFCISTFYNNIEEGLNESLLSREWKDLKLSLLHKAQMIDLSVPFKGNRSIFIARAFSNPPMSMSEAVSEIIGCCEVIEERLVISQQQQQQQNRCVTPRIRPIIENLAVKEEYRRRGVGRALLEACEKSVQTWIPFHDEVFAQIEDGNNQALEFFIDCRYDFLFADTSCTKVDLGGFAFSQTNVTKVMLRKVLDKS